MYLTYFGFIEPPFSNTPDRRFVYLSDRHREGLAHLLYALGEQGGFVQLTGEVGTGKTTLCRYFLDRLPADVDVALILNPMMTPIEMLATVCDELGIAYPTGTTSLKVFVDALHRRLLEAHERGRRIVLIVDEAQHLSVDVLEQMRLLTNLETAKAKLLQIVLIGQPELIELLSRRELRQVAQRVAARYHLLPLSERETHAYVLYRLGVGGQTEALFEDGAFSEVYRVSRGVPRLINVVCDRALLGAYATGKHQVDRAVARQAADEVFGELGVERAATPGWRPSRMTAAAIVAVIALGTLTTALATWSVLRPARPAAPAASASAPAQLTPPSERSASSASVQHPGAPASPVGAMVVADRPRLTTVLADATLRGDRGSAFATLYARWGVETARDDSHECKSGGPGGLSCVVRRGTWSMVRRLDLPAVLELSAPSGGRHYATLTAIDDATATLAFGEKRFTFALADVDAAWDGGFTVLSKAPRLATVPLRPGARGRDVAWLRQRLAEIEGTGATVKTSEVYDDELRARVIAFQRREKLVADGIVGDETLARLTSVIDTTVPSLSSAGRKS